MADYTDIQGDNQHSSLQENIRTLLELIDDPRGRVNTSNFIYQDDPRRKSADFGDYPIIYVENYALTNDSVNVGGNLFNKTLTVEAHIVAVQDKQQQKEWYDKVADRLAYKFEYGERQNLADQGFGQPEIVRNQSFTGIDADDQPVMRREIEIEAPTMIDMEQAGGGDPYA